MIRRGILGGVALYALVFGVTLSFEQPAEAACCVCSGCTSPPETFCTDDNSQCNTNGQCDGCDNANGSGNPADTCALGCNGNIAIGTPTSTPTNTPTNTPAPGTPSSTPTRTATNTPTNTPGAGTPTNTPSVETGLCNNNVDDDADLLIDCADPDCAGSPQCGVGAPALSPSLLLMLVFFLAGGAVLTLARKQRTE